MAPHHAQSGRIIFLLEILTTFSCCKINAQSERIIFLLEISDCLFLPHDYLLFTVR